MALKIIYPDGLDNKSETYLIDALQNMGAEHDSGREWHFRKGAILPDDFRKRLHEKLSKALVDSTRPHWLDEVIVEILKHTGPTQDKESLNFDQQQRDLVDIEQRRVRDRLREVAEGPGGRDVRSRNISERGFSRSQQLARAQ